MSGGTERIGVRSPVTNEAREPSAIAHFDTAEFLDALSLGIIVLDAQLCQLLHKSLFLLALPTSSGGGSI
jgi:hypothetical protein